MDLLKDKKFNFVSKENKEFIFEFTKQMNLFGYDFNGKIENGFCWGNFMIVYSQTGVVNKKVIARIYIRDNGNIIWGGKNYNFYNGIVLRLYFNNVNKHREYIENAPSFIKEPFINNNGICNNCKEECKSVKKYLINGTKIEKCAGIVFEFYDPKIENVIDYMNILKEFYSKKPKNNILNNRC